MAHVGVQGCRVRKGPRMCLERGRVDSGIYMSFRSTKFLSCLHNKAVCRQLPPGEKSELCSVFPPRPGGKDRQSLAGSRALKKSSTRFSRCGGASSDGQTALEKIAVVIVDHGSRRKESNDQLERFVELYRCFSLNLVAWFLCPMQEIASVTTSHHQLLVVQELQPQRVCLSSPYGDSNAEHS